MVAYRGNSEIRDPATGELLGTPRHKVGQLEVVEVVGEKLCTAKPVEGETLEIGDLVVPAVPRKAIAVLPFVDAGGNETNVGRQVAEELTTTLVNRGVSVVERSVFEKVIGELRIQHSSLVDSKTAQRVGNQIGAYAVLTGTVIPKEQTKSAEIQHTTNVKGESHATVQWGHTRSGGHGAIDGNDALKINESLRVVGPKPAGAEVQARLIRVETGEVLAAASQNVTGVTVRVVHSSEHKSDSTKPKNVRELLL